MRLFRLGQNEKFIFYFLSFFPIGFIYLISIDHSFFWDTSHLGSAQANWFFDNRLDSLYLPDSIDSGHPPFLGWLLALCWKIFGKGIVQSHLLMLPFIVLLCVQWSLIIRHYFDLNSFFLQLLFFLNPYLLGQSMLVSPDIILIAGFGLLLHGILANKNWKILTGSIILSVVSLRGMSCIAGLGLFVFYLYYGKYINKSIFKKYLFLFIPSLGIASAFLMYHYFSKGWIGYHAHSPWASSFEKVNLTGFFRNILIALWRFCDQGLIFLWVFPLWLLYKKRRVLIFSKTTINLFVLFTILIIVLLLPQLLYAQLLMHRYFLPLVFILSLLAVSVMIDAKAFTKKIMLIHCLFLISGFFWIYPDGISKGWDAMPLHYSYYESREEVLKKVAEFKIDKAKIGASFPYDLSGSVLDLSDDKTEFAHLDFKSNEFILYSNISNEFQKSDIEELSLNWDKKFTCGTWPVTFILYERRRN